MHTCTYTVDTNRWAQNTVTTLAMELWLLHRERALWPQHLYASAYIYVTLTRMYVLRCALIFTPSCSVSYEMKSDTWGTHTRAHRVCVPVNTLGTVSPFAEFGLRLKWRCRGQCQQLWAWLAFNVKPHYHSWRQSVKASSSISLCKGTIFDLWWCKFDCMPAYEGQLMLPTKCFNVLRNKP